MRLGGSGSSLMYCRCCLTLRVSAAGDPCVAGRSESLPLVSRPPAANAGLGRKLSEWEVLNGEGNQGAEASREGPEHELRQPAMDLDCFGGLQIRVIHSLLEDLIDPVPKIGTGLKLPERGPDF